jgi:hypothetical protein
MSTSPPAPGVARGDARASVAPRYDVRWPQDSGFGLARLSNTINVGAREGVFERPAARLRPFAVVGLSSDDRRCPASKGVKAPMFECDPRHTLS